MSRVPLGVELARLEETDPVVKAAAESFDATAHRIVEGRSTHPIPCSDEKCRWHHG